MTAPVPEVKPAPKRAARPGVLPKFTVLQSEVHRGTQSIKLHEILEYKGHKLELEVKSDAYQMQSYARISIFHPTDLKWNRLVDVAFSKMNTPEGLYAYPAATGNKPNLDWFRDLFDIDRLALLSKARLIL